MLFLHCYMPSDLENSAGKPDATGCSHQLRMSCIPSSTLQSAPMLAHGAATAAAEVEWLEADLNAVEATVEAAPLPCVDVVQEDSIDASPYGHDAKHTCCSRERLSWPCRHRKTCSDFCQSESHRVCPLPADVPIAGLIHGFGGAQPGLA